MTIRKGLVKPLADSSDCYIGMAAVITRGGKTISMGYNKKHRAKSLHAEEDALRKLVRQKRGPKGATLHVFRFLADDSYGMSKPCSRCMAQIIEAGIKKIHYHDYNGKPKVIKLQSGQ